METVHSQIPDYQEGDKLYIITRQDLDPGAQLAQSCHAAFAFALEHPELTKKWNTQSNYIAILAAKSEDDLIKLIHRLGQKGIKYSYFRESDLNDAITAVAIEPGDAARRATSCFPLALRQMRGA